MECTPKTYLEASQGTSTYLPDAAGRSAKSLNKSNLSIPVWHILLYNQSTVEVFSNDSLISNIFQAVQTLRLSFNTNTVYINLDGDIKGYREVYHIPRGISNILSLAWVKHIYRVTCDKNKGKWSSVHTGDGGTKRFV